LAEETGDRYSVGDVAGERVDTVVHDDRCLEGSVKTAQVLDEGAVDEGAVLAVEAMGKVFVFRVEDCDNFVSIFALKNIS
jgi:hypothetical protein